MPKPTAILNQVNIVGGDLDAAIAFYRRLGVEIAEPEPGPDGKPFHVGCGLANDFDLDLDSEAFARVWNAGWAGEANLKGRVVVGFYVPTREAVDAAWADLTGAGHRSLQPPWDAFWGARYAIVEDPNGVAVGLMSPVDPSRRWPLPENWPA